MSTPSSNVVATKRSSSWPSASNLLCTHKKTTPRLTPLDRAFGVALSQTWPRWKRVLCIVQPATVVCWHRKGFRLYWRSISRRGPGRPPISPELQALIRRLALENDWRARRIQAELEKLGFRVSLATVSRYLPKRRPNFEKRQGWTGDRKNKARFPHRNRVGENRVPKPVAERDRRAMG